MKTFLGMCSGAAFTMVGVTAGYFHQPAGFLLLFPAFGFGAISFDLK